MQPLGSGFFTQCDVSRRIPVTAGVSTSFPLVVQSRFIVWTQRLLFIHPCFHLSTIVNSAAVNVHILALV